MNKFFLIHLVCLGLLGCVSDGPHLPDPPGTSGEAPSEWKTLFEQGASNPQSDGMRLLTKVRVSAREKNLIDVEVSESRQQGVRGTETLYRARLDCEHHAYLIEEGSVTHKMTTENGATTKVPMKFSRRWAPVDPRDRLWKSLSDWTCGDAMQK